MTNIGVPKIQVSKKQNMIAFYPETNTWGCKICGKTEKPRDYVNIERHIWRKKEKQKRQAPKLQHNTRTPRAAIQELRLQTLTTKETSPHDHQNETDPKTPTANPNQNNSRNKTHAHETTPTLWGQLNIIKWGHVSNNWKCNINNCQTNRETQSSIAKHQAKARRDTCETISRTPTTCPYWGKNTQSGY